MKTRTTLSAALALALAQGALACGTCAVYHPGTASARDRLLATPAPYPAGRVDSPDRPQLGRVWTNGSRFSSGASRYGADARDHHRVIYVRRDHQVIAIDPWRPVTGPSRIGFDDLERARNLWLREQGYVLHVRTHVNERLSQGPQLVSSDLPHPRATIRRHIEKRTPETPIASRGPARYIGAVSTHELQADLAAVTDQP